MVRGRVLSVVYYCWSRSGHWPATVKTLSRTSSSAVSVECPFLYSCMQIGTGWSWRSWAGRAECVPARVSRGPWTWLAGWRWACSSLVNFHVWGISRASPIILKISLMRVQLISHCTLEFDRHQMKEVLLSFLNQTVSRSVYLLWSKLLCFFIGQRCYKYNRCACVLYLFLQFLSMAYISFLSVLWHHRLNIRKSIWPVKIESWAADTVICMEQSAHDLRNVFSWCHCHPINHHLFLH